MSERDLTASRALLTAALGGLLGVTSCSTTATPAGPTVDAASTDTGSEMPKDSAVSAVDSAATDTNTSDASAEASDAVAEASDAPVDAPIDACGDTGTEAGVILSSHEDTTMTLEIFTKMCDDRGGKLEIHTHCGGQNSCKGMSYDSGTKTFTEHSCKALNTCTGFSCVLPC